MLRRRGRDFGCPIEQVANAPDEMVDLAPVSNAPADAVKAAWAAWLPGQAVPLLWERGDDAEPRDAC